MRIEVLCFAVVREIVGAPAATIELPAAATAGTAAAALAEAHPALRPLLASVRLAVNEEFVAPDHALADGDRLALIPPVSGG